jgi:predicted ATP-binding protein involved in virulence
MRITRLEAQNIGPFENLDMEFQPKPAGMDDKAEIHILTGENGTGKSTILMMLASCWDKTNDKLIENRYKYIQYG